MLDSRGPSDRFELISTILKRICESPLRFYDGFNTIDKVKGMMEELN